MTVRDAAKLLEVSEKTVYDLCRDGLIEHLRIGIGRGVIRIEPEAVARFRESARVKARGPAARGHDLKHLKPR